MFTGLELMFMGVTQSYSGFFKSPGFLVSPSGKRGKGAKNRKEGKRGIEQERKEDRRSRGRSEAR